MPTPYRNTNNSFYFLIGGAYYKISAPNLVRKSSGEPVGWDAFKWVFRRNKRHGIDIRHSRGDITLKFTENSGINYIKDVYDGTGNTVLPADQKNKGFDGSIRLVMAETLNPTPPEPLIVFQADLMLSKLTKGDLGQMRGIQLPIVLEYFDDKLLNRFDLETELTSLESVDGETLNPINDIELSMHSHNLIKYLRWASGEFTTEKRKANGATATANFIAGYFDKNITEIEDSYGYGTTIIPNGTDLISDNLYISKFDQNGFIKYLEINHRFQVSFFSAIFGPTFTVSNVDFDSKIKLIRNGETIQDITLGSDSITTQTVNNNQLFEITIEGIVDFVVPIQEGDELYVYLEVTNDGSGQEEFINYAPVIESTEAESELLYDFVPIFERTNHKAFFVYEVLDKLISNVTGQEGLLYSEIYGRTDSQNTTYSSNGCASERVMFSGRLLRGYPLADNPPFASIETILDSLQMFDFVGMGIEIIGGTERVRVEKVSHFYQDTELLNLLNPADYKEEINERILFNRIVFEQKDWKIESKGGLDEFISKQTHSIPVQKIKGEYKQQSEVITGTYPTEWTRRKRANVQGAEDTKYDERMFMCNVVKIKPLSSTESINFVKVTNRSDNGLLGFAIELPNAFSFDFTKGLTVSGYSIDDNNGFYTIIEVGQFSPTGSKFAFVNREPDITGSSESVTLTYFNITTFSNTASNVFIVPEKTEYMEEATGMGFPQTAINHRMNLKESMLKHLRWIKALTRYKEGTDAFRFTSGEGNYNNYKYKIKAGIGCLEGNPLRIQYKQSDAVPISDTVNRIFTEKLISFRHKLTFAEIKTLENAFRAGNNGYISTIDEEGNPVSGFLAYGEDAIEWNPVTLMADIKLMKR